MDINNKRYRSRHKNLKTTDSSAANLPAVLFWFAGLCGILWMPLSCIYRTIRLPACTFSFAGRSLNYDLMRILSNSNDDKIKHLTNKIRI
jgi:hypothetical protein